MRLRKFITIDNEFIECRKMDQIIKFYNYTIVWLFFAVVFLISEFIFLDYFEIEFVNSSDDFIFYTALFITYWIYFLEGNIYHFCIQKLDTMIVFQIQGL